jgi:hypothetical protein
MFFAVVLAQVERQHGAGFRWVFGAARGALSASVNP